MAQWNPRLYREYRPAANRTLSTKRTWKERVLDLRHAVGLTVGELSELSGIQTDVIRNIEKHRGKPRPTVPTILAIRKVEAIFKEELIKYLHKPHGQLIQREWRYRRMDRYGGYKTKTTRGRLAARVLVTFQGRTLADIAQMEDVEAIRALKVVKTYPTATCRFTSDTCFTWDRPERGAYGRIIEAASRGHFMPIAEIASVVKGHQDA